MVISEKNHKCTHGLENMIDGFFAHYALKVICYGFGFKRALYFTSIL